MAVSRTLDRIFRVSITLKAIDGALEIIGGLILVVLSPRELNAIARALTQHDATRGFTRGTELFAGIYLLSHGIAKVVVIVAVLRDELWAYPAMLVLLGVFIVYQLYRLYFHLGIGLSLLTIFDCFVVWLTWREWRSKVEQRAVA